MTKLTLFASAASLCLLTNCTPYQPIDRGDTPGDVSVPVAVDDAEPAGTGGEIQDGAADGGAGEIDSAIGVVYKIRTRADVAATVDAMMTLADRDTNGQLTYEEYRILSPALAQADNSLTPSIEGGPVANPGAGPNMEDSTAEPIRRDDFFAETAGNDDLITRAELSTALTSRFNSADKDSNGEFTPEEAQNFAASMLFSKE
jgi:hypothetical protein